MRAFTRASSRYLYCSLTPWTRQPLATQFESVSPLPGVIEEFGNLLDQFVADNYED